jgi:hypothetical protein
VILRRYFMGVAKLRTSVGSKLMRNVVVRNASSQNFRGRDALASKERPTSTM